MIEKNYIKLFIVSALILVSSLVLGYMLSISSFEDFYKNSLISRYKMANEEIKMAIEASVNFGKPIDKYSGMEELLSGIITREAGVSNAFVTLPDGKVLYSFKNEYLGKMMADEIVPKFVKSEKSRVIPMGKRYFIVSPVYYKESEIAGNIYLEFEKSVISNKTKLVIKESLRILLGVMLGCIFVLFMAIMVIDFRCKKKDGHCNILSKANFAVIIIILVLSNLIYSYFNTISFKEKYLEIVDTNVDYFSKSVKNEVEFFLSAGLKLDRLNKIENILYKKLEEIPECKAVYVTDNNSGILYSAERNGNLVSKYYKGFIQKNIDIMKLDLKYNKVVFLSDKNGAKQGSVILALNNEHINSKIRDLFLDSLTVVIVSIIICFQMLLMVSIFSDRNKEESRQNDSNLKIVQIASFVFYFGELLSLSFIPILTNKIFVANPMKIMGLSQETIISLPISAYMLGAAIFVLLIGYFSNRYSERYIFISCAVLLIIGALGAAVTDSLILFTVFRFISGLGYGGISINSTNFILKNTDETKIASGFGYWTAGYAAASICAIPIGGVIVYRFGYMNALLVSAVFAVLFLIFVFSVIKSKEIKKNIIKEKGINFYDLIGIFKDKNIAANMLFTIIPFQLVYVGIFQYLMPLYMNKEGISQANIGRILTIFGIVYLLVPFVSRYVDKIKNDRLFIGMGNMIIGLFLLLFNLSDSFIVFIIIIIGLSIGSMMGDAAEESFITSSKKAKEIGGVKLMGIYSSYERIVMVFAPIITGALIANTGYSKSVVIIGIITIIAAVIFTAVSENPKKGERDNE